jgi:hypothetical protein
MEFICSGTDHTGDAHSDVSATVWLTDLVSLLCKTPSWQSISFDPTLIEEPKVNALIFQRLSDQFDEGFPFSSSSRRLRSGALSSRFPDYRAIA